MTTKPEFSHPFTIAIPSQRVSTGYLAALGLGQLGLYIAILSPVFVSMQLKAQALDPGNPASVIGVVLPIGSIGAILGNPLFGALSDRTRTRWGRRKPWMLGGIIVLALGLVFVAYAPNVLLLTIAWFICQLGNNATFAALVASLADNVPEEQRGRASSILGLAQNVAILVGTYATALLVSSLSLVFIVPAAIGVVLVIVYVVVTPDHLPTVPVKPFRWADIVRTFWTNPFTHRDYGLAWWSRFLIILATFLFTTYRVFYVEDHLHVPASQAVAKVAFGVLIYTILLFIGTAVSGWLSDRLHRRKIFVGGSTLLFGVGLLVLVFANSLAIFYVAEAIMGLAYGIYISIDQALVIDVLPEPEKPGKDLGVMNIANALPQTAAPALGVLLLAIGGGSQNYEALLIGAGLAAIVGALVVIPIRSVR